MDKHWTNESVEAYKYAVCSDFVCIAQQHIDAKGITNQKLAEVLGVTEDWVVLFLERPGNLTLENMIILARFLGLHLGIVAYEEGSRPNPINGDIFRRCWEYKEKPQDFFDIGDFDD